MVRLKLRLLTNIHTLRICFNPTMVRLKLTPAKRLLFQLAPLVPYIEEKEFSLLPTPIARDWKSGSVSMDTLNKNSRPLSDIAGGLLNPNWIEQLMGLV